MVPTDVSEEKNDTSDLRCDFLKLGAFRVIWPFLPRCNTHMFEIKGYKAVGKEIRNVGN